MTTDKKNPLLSDFYFPPFGEISVSDYLPAVDRAIAAGLAEVDTIVSNEAEPTFENTVEALERAGAELERVLGVFYPLLSADADDELLDLASDIAARVSDYSSRISLNAALFGRIKAVYEHRATLGLNPEQMMLLENTWHGFVRGGADLEGADRERFREINARLSELSTLFGNNVKKELAGYYLELDGAHTEGLPQWLLDTMRENAAARGSEAPYVLTLQAPEYMAFMKLSPFADLREKVWRMYSGRNLTGEYSNVDIVRETANLRLEKARLLGYESFADFKLARTMARTPSAALGLLDRLHDAYAPALRRELDELAEFAGEEITPWNYAWHSNRLRKARYDFDPEEMRPYFELSAVIGGVFGLAGRLYGISFTERTDIPVYHPDVKAYQVNDADGSTLGYLYADFFPRAGRKSPGAWMTEFREADATTRPLVNIVMNFTKPTGGAPSLLLPGEVTTFLHEFGHALHSLLTRARYSSLAGTNVYRDFVELPSQFNENFFRTREFLDGFARHYQTGAPLPDELFDRLTASECFGAAYACMRQLGFGYLDFGFHTITEPIDDVIATERTAAAKAAVFTPVDGTSTATSFGHIFSGGYAAGYYSYKWAEVLDADAFDYFSQQGTFNPAPALAFRRNILERGGTAAPDELYRAFRGRDPQIDALLRRDGIRN